MVPSIFPMTSRGALAAPGTPSGDQVRDAFYSKLLAILGDVRLLWVPETGETTTSTDRSRNARTLTYDATVAARYSPLGSLWALDFNGTTHEADTPDADGLSFGDGAADQPFSIVVLVNPDNVTSRSILTKYDAATGDTKREWEFQLNGSPRIDLTLWDESAAATIVATSTGVPVTGLQLLSATYDGSAANTGIRLYRNGLGIARTLAGTGTYTAMENTASLVRLGFRQGTAAGERFFDGQMAFVALVGRMLSADEQWSIKELVNSYYDLSL